jgi:hypothetical protein
MPLRKWLLLLLILMLIMLLIQIYTLRYATCSA